MSIENKSDELKIQKKKIRKNNMKKIMATTLASSIVLQSTTNVFADELIFKDNELSNINIEVKEDTNDKEVTEKEHTTNVNSKDDNEINNEEKEVEIKEETNDNEAPEEEDNNLVNSEDKNETNSEEKKVEAKDNKTIEKENTNTVNSKYENVITSKEKEVEVKESTSDNKAIKKESANPINSNSEDSNDNEVVNIPDPNLKAALNKALRKDQDSNITKEELKSITRLEVEASNITDLNGLQYCTNIYYLHLARNQIKDISPLSGLTKLETLYLYENQISDISPLSKLTSLGTLELGDNQISDISPLSGLKNLYDLGLGNNPISDISLLSGLTDLCELFIEDCQISDISPLSGLTNLISLCLNNNQISDIGPLSKLTNLEDLYLDKNQISDLTPLSGLENLWCLVFNDNQISDLTPLSGLNNLMLLEIQNNQISDLSPLSNLNELVQLYAGNQTIYEDEIKVDSESVEIKNEIKSVDGSIVNPTDISDGGEYDPNTNLIKWDNINSNCSRTYNFKKVLDPNTKYSVFSGKVIQSIKYSNDKPIISGADDISIKEGSTFDPRAGVTATDTEDGDITNKIDITGAVNTNEPGKYELTYTVKDNTGNIVTVKRIVTVNPKMESINSIPTITAEDKVLTVGDNFNPLDGVTAHDKEDGDITVTEKNIFSNNVDMSQAGTYNITYKVTDSKGASSIKTITVIVNPKIESLNSVPTITASDKVLTVGDSFDPLKEVTAYDKEDDDITDKIEVIENTVDMSKYGTYNVTYKVTDKNGASSIKTITVVVNPKMELINSIPTITANDKVLTVGDEFNPLDGVTAYDEEDGDITDKIEIIENTVDMEQAGTYTITYKVTDSKGASTVKTITIEVVNNDTVNEPEISEEDNSNSNSNNDNIVSEPDNLEEDNQTVVENNNSSINSNNAVVNNNTNKDTSIPETGDAGVLGSAWLGFTALLGLIFNNRKKKK